MAKITRIKAVEYDAKYLYAQCKVRYTEDAILNGVEDEDGNMPFLRGDYWEVAIDIDEGVILNWPAGNTASIHYKVCDEGSYVLRSADGAIIATIDNDYVPGIMSPGGPGYGDYVVMSIEEDGKIRDWDSDLSDWPSED